ncbi:uncharacterized protein KY384_003577 [Bacidia gigantensis]|uniref:uncharacterized protein n=1 Tax=Bacidia gigantensis TaxID=2732470 RepID=UPI001D045A15|nr:uncharacterized protein KY384_003577 [Bacidia gigantensis]KAG8531941.1 hypothetical protein KY384_003577 [Bacidia gigantensis]
MFRHPFPQEAELEKSLVVETTVKDKGEDRQQLFLREDEQEEDFNLLPGCSSQQACLQSVDSVTYVLNSELLTPDLDRMAPYLWLVATPRSSHISSLHQQIVKGRTITVTENPELHCTWIYDRFFVKPITPCILSWAFWHRFLLPLGNDPLYDEPGCRNLRHAATGLLRTYFYLVKHPSDFRIAKEHHLIPRTVTYTQCLRFFSHFADITDDEVSPRYYYGDLRLGRLNFWAKPLLRRFYFQKVLIHYGYGTYFSRFFGPLLFIFAFFTVVLSAMQVVLTVETIKGDGDSHNWMTFAWVCRWFGIYSIITAFVFFAVLVFMLVFMTLREALFAIKKLTRKGKAKK